MFIAGVAPGLNGYQRSSGPSRIRTPAPGSAIVPGLTSSSPMASARCLPTSRTASTICSAGHSGAPCYPAGPAVPVGEHQAPQLILGQAGRARRPPGVRRSPLGVARSRTASTS